jgi:hypothetical protein
MYWPSLLLWTLMMGLLALIALMCGFGIFFGAHTYREGLSALLSCGILSMIVGLFAVYGLKRVRHLQRCPDTDPEFLSVPLPFNDILTVRATSYLDMAPPLSFAAIGWCGVLLCGGSLLGWVSGSGSAVAGLVIAGLFVAFAHSVLLGYAVTIKIDLRRGRWYSCNGIWPFRSVASGDLGEASHLAVGRETRSDEGAEYTVLVARIAWKIPDREPLVLAERPNEFDCLRYGARATTMDYRPALSRWAAELAGLLGLPLKILESIEET